MTDKELKNKLLAEAYKVIICKECHEPIKENSLVHYTEGTFVCSDCLKPEVKVKKKSRRYWCPGGCGKRVIWVKSLRNKEQCFSCTNCKKLYSKKDL